jgi:hypothetical protein
VPPLGPGRRRPTAALPTPALKYRRAEPEELMTRELWIVNGTEGFFDALTG